MSDAVQACPRAAQSLLRDWLPGWCGSIVLHGAAVCCFVATAEYGPQVWPVARGRSSVASAPAIDAQAGGLLTKFAEQTPSIQIEPIDAPDVSASEEVLPAPRIVTEVALNSARIAAREESERFFSRLVSQLPDILPESKELSAERKVVRVDPEAIRDQELLRSVEPNPPPEAKSEHGSYAREGNATENSAASTPSAASNGAEDSPLPQPVATNVAPPYPEEARAAGLYGKVTLRLRIGVDGRVESLKILTSSGVPSLDESALATVKQWRFEPARRLGRPVAMDVKASVNFQIETQ